MKKYISPQISVSEYCSKCDLMLNSELDLDMGGILELEKAEQQAAARREQ